MAEPVRREWAPWARGWTPVLLFVLGISLVRLVYMIWLSPYTLAEDEAHYWEWSRHLDWSYYSKGPGVSWAIALSTGIFGDSEWAVRLPAIVAAAVGSLASALTARTVFADKRSGWVAAVLYQCVPPFSLLGFLMTIDGPFLAAWAVACTAAVKAARTRAPRWLIAVGLALAVGFLFKYTIVLLAGGLIIAAVWGRRTVRFPAWAWVAAILAFALGLVPVIIWNAGEDWVTVRHLLGHLGVKGGDMPATQGEGGWHYSPLWTLTYMGMLLLAGPPLLLGVYSAVKNRGSDVGVGVLTAASVPVLVFYLLVTFVAEAEGNWALGGFVGLVPLAAGVIPRALDRRFIPLRAGWRLSIVAGVCTLVALPMAPVLARVPTVGQLIPVHRLSGMRTLASGAEARLEELKAQTGREPFLMADHYGRASQLAFYVEGQPTVYAAGSMTRSGRRSQYDLWPETDLRNHETIERLNGRPALLFGADQAFWRSAFETVEEIPALAGEPKRGIKTFLATGFRGFPEAEQRGAP